MTQPILLAPVTRAVAAIIADWLDAFELELEEDEVALIACNIANELSARPDPDDLRRWWITLPSADGTDPDMRCAGWTSDYRPHP